MQNVAIFILKNTDLDFKPFIECQNVVKLVFNDQFRKKKHNDILHCSKLLLDYH